jgi:hypothetical protein
VGRASETVSKSEIRLGSDAGDVGAVRERPEIRAQSRVPRDAPTPRISANFETVSHCVRGALGQEAYLVRRGPAAAFRMAAPFMS